MANLVPIVLNRVFIVGVLLIKSQRNPTGYILADQIAEMDCELSCIKEDDCLYNQDRTSHVCLLLPEGC